MQKPVKDAFFMNVLILGVTIGAFILFMTSCITGSTNPTADKVIKETEAIYPADNPIEEEAEEIIEDVTTLKVDLSPGTPEHVDATGPQQGK